MAQSENIRHLSLVYDGTASESSALQLILALRPEWAPLKDHIEFKRFTDGITNTLLKATLRQPGNAGLNADRDAVLLRAYGKGTGVLIDRDRECRSHSLLAQHNLAPPLLARFENGLLYQYLEGSACSPADLRRPEIWQAVARRLAQWHAVMPVPKAAPNGLANGHTNGLTNGQQNGQQNGVRRLPDPNLWSTLRKWLEALPARSPEQRARREALATELDFLVSELGSTHGIRGHKLVFCHCDLLSGNVIIEPPSVAPANSSGQGTAAMPGTTRWGERHVSVSFIDYEYSTPAPAAFDIANHFAEWGGFDCEYSVLPTRSQRRDFIQHYVHTYRSQLREPANGIKCASAEEEVEQLFTEVDRFRGIPGFYWGIWALIQATISQIDFDYANYAEVRLDEYWAWKRSAFPEQAGKMSGGNSILREKRWAEE